MPFQPVNDTHSIERVALKIQTKHPEWNLAELADQLKVGSAFVQEIQEHPEFNFALSLNEAQQQALKVQNFYSVKENNNHPYKGKAVILLNEPTGLSVIIEEGKYTRWSPFFDFVKDSLAILNNSLNDINAAYLTLTYHDVFVWIGDKQTLKWDELLSQQSKFVTPNIFENANTSLRSESLLSLALKDDAPLTVAENIVIRRMGNELVLIIHQVQCAVENNGSSSSLEQALSLASELHKYNKKVLKDLLIQPIKETIKLN